jgi:23S rRNA (cytidine1920-2'-O)/16S rRNA (cytidine1409-2'-O)-methyltransferase
MLTDIMPQPKPKRIRLDELVIKKGMALSKTEAQAIILAGKLRTLDRILDKPGKEIPEDTELILEKPPRYVGRGGEKLHAFVEQAGIDLNLGRALDIGASTGGFTDCLLQKGVQQVVCLDVGRGQLHPKLQRHPAVINIEQYNARHLQACDLPFPDFPLIVTDVSFISLRLILPPAWPLLSEGGLLIALIKPQFEADKNTMDRCHGVIKDPELRDSIAISIRDFALDTLPGSRLFAYEASAIQGTDGNQEFLMALKKVSAQP